ncbi:MAG: hypothetical protein AABY75_05235, partial [Bacteroidota bacterium]
QRDRRGVPNIRYGTEHCPTHDRGPVQGKVRKLSFWISTLILQMPDDPPKRIRVLRREGWCG